MGETLTEQRRVNDEALRGVKFCDESRNALGGNAQSLTD
jgi:hypothetical protein